MGEPESAADPTCDDCGCVLASHWPASSERCIPDLCDACWDLRIDARRKSHAAPHVVTPDELDWRAKYYTCPQCDAPQGKPCKLPGGLISRHLHMARLRLPAKALNDSP